MDLNGRAYSSNISSLKLYMSFSFAAGMCPGLSQKHIWLPELDPYARRLKRSSKNLIGFASGTHPKIPAFKPEECKPIYIRDLELGQVHQGRVLLGTLAAAPLAAIAVHTLLQDEQGDIVQVSFIHVLKSLATG